MRALPRSIIPLVPMVVSVILLSGPWLRSQVPSQGVRLLAGASPLTAAQSSAGAIAELREVDLQVRALARDGELALTQAESDLSVPGRTHERLAQVHRGVRVFGGEVTRQVNGFGQTESIFGVYYPGVDVEVEPQLSAAQAAVRLIHLGEGHPATAEPVELMVLPEADGGFRLSWTSRVLSAADGIHRRVFIDADTGASLLTYVDTWTQFAVGRGTGVLGDPKKVISMPSGGQFLAVDQARPVGTAAGLPAGNNITFDMRGDYGRWLSQARPLVTDIAEDADNTWVDAGVVDAHVHAGLTYDYYFRRFGRNGVNNGNLQTWTFTNLVRRQDYSTLYGTYPNFFTNAAYIGSGRMYFGVGLPAGVTIGGRTYVNLAGGLDVVAHELTHAVTGYTSGLIYLNESGALNEAFSDIVGASVEWYYQTAGSSLGQADWLVGEDIARPRGFRSMSAPSDYGHPDHYSIRFRGTSDNGGVHSNSGIANHAFFLTVVGGTHRLSGVTVTGIGFANRERAERIFYRAFTTMLPASATFALARAATIQAARDLYGAGSPDEAAITQAWDAVGVS